MTSCRPGGGPLFWRVPADQGAELTSSQIHNLEHVLFLGTFDLTVKGRVSEFMPITQISWRLVALEAVGVGAAHHTF